MFEVTRTHMALGAALQMVAAVEGSGCTHNLAPLRSVLSVRETVVEEEEVEDERRWTEAGALMIVLKPWAAQQLSSEVEAAHHSKVPLS